MTSSSSSALQNNFKLSFSIWPPALLLSGIVLSEVLWNDNRNNLPASIAHPVDYHEAGIRISFFVLVFLLLDLYLLPEFVFKIFGKPVLIRDDDPHGVENRINNNNNIKQQQKCIATLQERATYIAYQTVGIIGAIYTLFFNEENSHGVWHAPANRSTQNFLHWIFAFYLYEIFATGFVRGRPIKTEEVLHHLVTLRYVSHAVFTGRMGIAVVAVLWLSEINNPIRHIHLCLCAYGVDYETSRLRQILAKLWLYPFFTFVRSVMIPVLFFVNVDLSVAHPDTPIGIVLFTIFTTYFSWIFIKKGITFV